MRVKKYGETPFVSQPATPVKSPFSSTYKAVPLQSFDFDIPQNNGDQSAHGSVCKRGLKRCRLCHGTFFQTREKTLNTPPAPNHCLSTGTKKDAGIDPSTSFT